MDAAKTLRRGNNWVIDYNRSGVPLVEIVTEPDINTAEEIEDLIDSIRKLAIRNRISNCDLSKGDLRFDLNISTIESMAQVVPVVEDGVSGENLLTSL